MTDFAPAAFFALFTWWFSTGVLLYIDHLPRRTFKVSFAIATGLALLALWGLVASSQSTSNVAAYIAFVCAVVIWAWHELTFLMGFVTGPRKSPCPPDASEWHRLRLAVEIVIHHELALAATVVLMKGLTWEAPNEVGTTTFLVLWVMRLSAKFNLFLGVHNLTTEFIPDHLSYMLTYFRQARLNPLMPISVAAGTAGVVWLTGHALALPTEPFIATATGLLATTLALAVLEHLFLVLPVPDAWLWRWAQRPSEGS